MSLYEGQHVRVTKSVFEVPGTQFPIRNIGAVKVYNYEVKFWTFGKFLATVFLTPAYGLGLLIPAYWALKKFVLKHPSRFFGIVVVSAGTESKAYESANSDEIHQIQKALNEAIASVAA